MLTCCEQYNCDEECKTCCGQLHLYASIIKCAWAALHMFFYVFKIIKQLYYKFCSLVIFTRTQHNAQAISKYGSNVCKKNYCSHLLISFDQQNEKGIYEIGMSI